MTKIETRILLFTRILEAVYANYQIEPELMEIWNPESVNVNHVEPFTIMD